MTTPLPSRLRESAKALRGLSPCSEHSYELLDVVAWNIAAELTEAADALEAGRHSGGSEGLHETGFHAWDEADEFAEDWPNLPHAKWAELDALVTDWLNKNVPVTFWTVRDVKPVTVTEALLAEWREPAAGVDACATCGGARGGVPGNENLVDGKPMCDYCHSDLIRTHGVKESARWCGACDTYRAMCDCDTSGVAGTSGNQSKGPK